MVEVRSCFIAECGEPATYRVELENGNVRYFCKKDKEAFDRSIKPLTPVANEQEV